MFGIALETPSVKVQKNLSSLFKDDILEGDWQDYLKIIVNINWDILWLFNTQSLKVVLNEEWNNKKEIINKNILFYKKKKWLS